MGLPSSMCPDEIANPAFSKASRDAELLRCLVQVLLHLEQNSQVSRGLLRQCKPKNSERGHGHGSSGKARLPAALL